LLLPGGVSSSGGAYTVVRTGIVSFFEVNSATPVTTPFVGCALHRQQYDDSGRRSSDPVFTIRSTGLELSLGMGLPAAERPPSARWCTGRS